MAAATVSAVLPAKNAKKESTKRLRKAILLTESILPFLVFALSGEFAICHQYHFLLPYPPSYNTKFPLKIQVPQPFLCQIPGIKQQGSHLEAAEKQKNLLFHTLGSVKDAYSISPNSIFAWSRIFSYDSSGSISSQLTFWNVLNQVLWFLANRRVFFLISSIASSKDVRPER